MKEKKKGENSMVDCTEFLRRVYEMDVCSFVFEGKMGVIRSGITTPGMCRDNKDSIEVCFGDDSEICILKSRIESVAWEKGTVGLLLSEGETLVVENDND